MKLEPMPASAELCPIVAKSKNEVLFDDVLVGEVWLTLANQTCSGLGERQRAAEAIAGKFGLGEGFAGKRNQPFTEVQRRHKRQKSKIWP